MNTLLHWWKCPNTRFVFVFLPKTVIQTNKPLNDIYRSSTNKLTRNRRPSSHRESPIHSWRRLASSLDTWTKPRCFRYRCKHVFPPSAAPGRCYTVSKLRKPCRRHIGPATDSQSMQARQHEETGHVPHTPHPPGFHQTGSPDH